MKIMFFLPNLGAGGAERVVTILSSEFVKINIEVDIVLMMTEKIQYQVPEKVNVVCLNSLNMTKRQRLSVIRLYLKEQKAAYGNIVIIPFQDNCLKYVLLASVGLNIPVIACERNNPYQKGVRVFDKLKANIPYLLSTSCVFQTSDARDYYCYYVRKKARVIANPINLDDRYCWKGENSKTVISVGRLEIQKNQRNLIEAFALVHEKYPEYTLDIYGEGMLRKKLQEQIKMLKLETCVFLRGHCEDIYEKMENAYVFVLSSDYEGMSNALIEAMAIGVPTISTDHPIGAARMIIQNGKNGILVPTGNKKELYNAIKLVIENPKKGRNMAECAMKIRKELDVKEIVRQWLKIILTINKK